jgi:heavy metal translocating P-type ATPase
MPQTKLSRDAQEPKPAASAAGWNEGHANGHRPIEEECGRDQEHGQIETFDLIRIAITSAAAALVWFRAWEPLPHVSVIGAAGILFGGWPIFHEAFENLRERRMTMELSMTIALLAAAAIGEFFTALIITAFVLAAEVLEGLTVSRGRRAIGDLLEVLPRTAWVVKEGSPPAEVAVERLCVGDRVLVRPGTRIPVDGSVIAGNSAVEEAAITGEPLPQDKQRGSRVFAGTVNQTGALEVIVESLGGDTTFGKIVEAVERAEQTRAPIQRMADRLAGYLVYFALGSALLTLAITHNLRSTISVVIVAGACGIAAGTPLAILGAIGRAARQGAIVKGGVYLEQLAKIDTVLLDKTGTLTYGRPEIASIEPTFGWDADDLLEIAAAAERNSEHPLARAIFDAAQQRHLPIGTPSTFTYIPGKGVRAVVGERVILVGNVAWLEEFDIRTPARTKTAGTSIFIACDGAYAGSIQIADHVREGALEAIRELKSLGLKVELLTGDSPASADAVAKSLGIQKVLSGLLPEHKSLRVDELTNQGHTVAMIGDGINDAPALARASVGIAMGSGTEIAHASANVLLIGNDLRRFAETVKTARWCRRVIFQNFYGTLGVDALGILLAAIGVINPLLAAFIHVSSELTFILNSTRLLPRFAGRSR